MLSLYISYFLIICNYCEVYQNKISKLLLLKRTDRNSFQIDEIGYLLVLVHAAHAPLVEPHADEMGRHELGPDRAQDIVSTVLHLK